MIVLNPGMQKSGSAYIYNLLNDSLQASGGQDARYVKNKYGLENIMKWANNAIGWPGLFKCMRLYRISQTEGPFVVKTHSGPNWVVKLFVAMGAMKVIYIYRDPRDVLLSAVDHGNRILAEGGSHTFAKFANFDAALRKVKRWIKRGRGYKRMPNVLTIKYEDLMFNAVTVLKECEEYLGIEISDDVRSEIIWKYDRTNTDAKMDGLHFNKAQTMRWKTEMSDEQKKICDQKLGKYLVQMGYELYQ